MHILLRCPEGRRFEDLAPARSIESSTAKASLASATVPFALLVQQNRSSFPASDRLPLLAMLGLSFAATIAPAMRGYYLVPIAVLVSMASLLLALELFQRQPVPSETIEIDFDLLTITDHHGTVTTLPSHWTRIEEVRKGPFDLRLMLHCHWQSIEIGHCVDSTERGRIAPLIRAALAHVRGGSR